ncbi:mevalonate kinase [Pediococcus siamensis]|uniref:mevalonate kinase n=1 Tax=Pediococcus siamensis TaxID=381829 RepID=UPI0039A35432
MLKSATGQSHAKIIFWGEHSVVYGQPAICFPISEIKTTVVIEQTPTGQHIQSRYFNGSLTQMPESQTGIQLLINTILTLLDEEHTPFQMKISSAIPAERGMGSSAATAIAIIRAFYHFFQHPLTHAELLRLADVSEQYIHGNPSGLDAATAGSRVPIWFIRGRRPQAIPINQKAYLIIADTGIMGQTGLAVQHVKKQLAENPQAQPAIEKLGANAKAARTLLADGNTPKLGAIMTNSHHLLQTLGVSHPALDKLAGLALSHGALGAKLTGGGMGGCLIALTDTSEKAKKIASLLEQNGAVQTWIEPLARMNHKGV